MTEVKF